MTIVEPRPQLVRPAADLAAVRGDLERLYVEHGDRVRAICASILRNPQESEDAAQQVFVSALRALWSGTEPRDPGAWLATIARHESWARARCQAGVPLSEELEDVTSDDPVTTVVRRAELAHAWQTIAELPPSQRQALLLREVRGLGYDELADDLRLSHASVRSLLSRARRTLRRQLEKGAGALTGAPWLNVFARLVSDTSNPALSSASRTAAVGFGALVLTGGAVVAPTLTPHVRTHTLARNETSDGTVHRGTTDPTVAGAAVVPERVKLAKPSEVATRDRHARARPGHVDAAVSTHDGGRRRGHARGPDDGSRGGRSDDGAVAVPSNGSSGGSGTPSSGGAGTQTSGRDSAGGSGSGPVGSEGGLVSSGAASGSSGGPDSSSSGRGPNGSDGSASAAAASGTNDGPSTNSSGSSDGASAGDSTSGSSTIGTPSIGGSDGAATSSNDGSGDSSGSGGSGGSSVPNGSGGSTGSDDSGGSGSSDGGS